MLLPECLRCRMTVTAPMRSQGPCLTQPQLTLAKCGHSRLIRAQVFTTFQRGGCGSGSLTFHSGVVRIFFYISTVHTRYRYCTERFKDLVESHKFTNFRFTGALNPEGNWFFA